MKIYIVKSKVSNTTQRVKCHTKFYGLKCQKVIKSISQIMQCQQVTITRAKVNYKVQVSHNIHHSLMSAVVGEKLLVILSSIGIHMAITHQYHLQVYSKYPALNIFYKRSKHPLYLNSQWSYCVFSEEQHAE